jgi:hypothetical protein
MQFARFLPAVAQRCGTLIVIGRADLLPLLATLPGIAQLREAGQIGVSEFDTYLPLLSVPHVLGVTRETIPAETPYFNVAAIRRRKPAGGLPQLPPTPQLKVGLVWAGSPTHRHDRHRSCALQTFEPLLRVPGVTFFSVQKGERSRELATLPADIVVSDLERYLQDFGDLAVILEQLDLVITVDTSVAHLAGALGKPVWTLLSAVPDWRWGFVGETTPWYPTMRLFRQTQSGQWGEVLARVAQTLTYTASQEQG